MSLLFFGKDPNSDGDECPSVFVDDQNANLVFQGWKGDAETRAQARVHGSIPDTEDVIRVPASMVDQIRKACDEAERRATAELR
ncbi:hypothetical protein V7793_05125 [Streptomyces sp. KLMMK]|uniref:hypothetical protein n=1 Tax=Streptomyces sp. KLMMK TaxID=3109353 RepID=UPI00300051D4